MPGRHSPLTHRAANATPATEAEDRTKEGRGSLLLYALRGRFGRQSTDDNLNHLPLSAADNGDRLFGA